MAVTGHGATFTFSSNLGSASGRVTSISVDTPSAELVDMTSLFASAGSIVIVPTGSWKGGAVSVEFTESAGTASLTSLVRGYGNLTFASPGFTVSRQVVLESASSAVAVGEVVKGSAKFVITDYYG